MTPMSQPNDVLVERCMAAIKAEGDKPATGEGLVFSYGEVERGLTAALEASNEKMREALEACRAKFAEYVELHKVKLNDDTPTREWLSVQQKVERNQAMVRLCDAALQLTDKGRVDNG